jgi:sec-independent protein translocase protein TatA
MIEDLLRPQHLLIILGIAILFFGPQKLPELGKGLGRGIRGFKESLKEVSSEAAAEPKDQQHDPTSRPV